MAQNKMYVMVPDTYDENRTPKYTWKWEPFQWYKLSHWNSLLFQVYRSEDQLDD